MNSPSKRRLNVIKQAGLLLAVVLLTLFVSQHLAPTQAYSQNDSRLSRLESQNSRLASRISRLESLLTQLGRGGSAPAPDVRLNDGPMASSLSNDPMFERLSTLAIEQKERLDQLESRLAALEQWAALARHEVPFHNR